MAKNSKKMVQTFICTFYMGTPLATLNISIIAESQEMAEHSADVFAEYAKLSHIRHKVVYPALLLKPDSVDQMQEFIDSNQPENLE